MSLLNSSQRIWALASFRHLDSLLTDAARLLREASLNSPFAEHVRSRRGPGAVPRYKRLRPPS